MKRCTFFVSLLFLLAAQPVLACDPCSLYSASRLQGHSAGAFTFSVSEQYTDFDLAQGLEKDHLNQGEYVKGFSTTQFSLGYDISDRTGLQLTIPLVARRFDDVTETGIESDSDAGLGDISLAGTYSFLDIQDQDWGVIAGLTGGIKFPTGETGALEDVAREEEHEEHDEDEHGEEAGEHEHEEESLLRHHAISTASGGRALVFGTGSYDYILGLNFLSRYKSALVLSSIQYTIRTEGDFNYEFADDLLFSFGPGYYFMRDHGCTVAGLVSLTGEFKGKDHLDGDLVEKSQVSNLYLGPQAIFTIDENWGGEVALDFRVTNEDQSSTVVPESRVRASIAYRF